MISMTQYEKLVGGLVFIGVAILFLSLPQEEWAKFFLLTNGIFGIAILWLVVRLKKLRNERRQLEDSLTCCQWYKLVLNTVGEGILVTDKQGITIFANPIAMKLTGYFEEDFIGHDQHALLCHANSEGMPFTTTDCLVHRTSQDGQPRTVKGEMFKRKDGTNFPVEYVTTPLWGEEGIIGTVLTFRDVSWYEEMEKKFHEAIFQHQETKNALRNSELYLQALFNNVVAGVTLISLQGYHLQCNAKWLEMTGYSAEDILQRNFLDMTYPDEMEACRQQLNALVEGTIESFHLEQRYLKKEGTVFWGDVSMTTVRNQQGTGQMLIAVIIDITRHKRAEEQLYESDERLNTLINTIPDIICLKDKEGRWLNANRADLELFQLQDVNYRGKKGLELAHFTDNSYRSAFLTCDLLDKKAWETKAVVHSEQVFHTAQGDRVHDIIKVPVFDKEGQPKRIIVLGRDITDRKRAEEQLREAEAKYHSLVDQIPAVTYIVKLGEQPELQYISPQIEKMLGFSLKKWAEEPRLWRNLIHPDDRKRVVTEYLHYLTTLPRDKPLVSEYRMLTCDEETVWVRGQAVIIRDPDAHPLFLQGIMMDVTEHKQAETALRQANERLNVQLSELDQRNQEITLLGSMGNLLQTCQVVDEAHNVIAHFMGQLFPHTTGMLGMLKASSNMVESVAVWGTLAEKYQDLVFIPADCWALRRGKTYQVTDTKTELACKHLAPHSVETSLCIPLMAQGELLGVLHISQLLGENSQQHTTRQRLAEMVAEHIGLALSNLRLRETLRSQSIRDPLTGLFNRRYLEEALEQEIHRSSRYQYPLGIIMLDLDYFKQFNDTFGHDAGDAALQTLGRFLKMHLRKGDIICRYGGEEFTIVLPRVTQEEAYHRAELLKNEVKHLSVQHRGQVLGTLSMSMGIAIFPHHGKTSNEVLHAADAALYLAKTQGRDRVVMAE